MNYFDQEMQPKNTEFAIINELENSLNKLRGFKFAITLVLKVKKKQNKDETKYSTFSSNSKAETNIHNSDIDNPFK